MLKELEQGGKSGYIINFDLDHLAMIIHSIESIKDLQDAGNCAQ